MKPLKNAIKKTLSGVIGFRNSDPSGSLIFQNFVNLSRSYEFRLNELTPDSPIKADDLRPKLLGRLLGTPPSEAYYLVQGLSKSKHVDGDVCEFGVAQGETSALIANEIRETSKRLHLFDSFEGLPSPTEKDQLKDDIFNLGSMEAYTGTMACPEDMVRARLRAISFPDDRFVIHKGFVDNVLKNNRNLPSQISFAYVDFDFYEPLQQALDFIHDRMPVGGIMVVDDYDWFSTGAKTAVDEFVLHHNAEYLKYQFFVPDKTLGCFAVIERVAS